MSVSCAHRVTWISPAASTHRSWFISKYFRITVVAPTFYYQTSGIWAVFQKDILNEEYLQTLGFNHRQVKAVLYAKEKGKLTNKEHQKLNNTPCITATCELIEIVNGFAVLKVSEAAAGTLYHL